MRYHHILHCSPNWYKRFTGGPIDIQDCLLGTIKTGETSRSQNSGKSPIIDIYWKTTTLVFWVVKDVLHMITLVFWVVKDVLHMTTLVFWVVKDVLHMITLVSGLSKMYYT